MPDLFISADIGQDVFDELQPRFEGFFQSGDGQIRTLLFTHHVERQAEPEKPGLQIGGAVTASAQVGQVLQGKREEGVAVFARVENIVHSEQCIRGVVHIIQVEPVGQGYFFDGGIKVHENRFQLAGGELVKIAGKLRHRFALQFYGGDGGFFHFDDPGIFALSLVNGHEVVFSKVVAGKRCDLFFADLFHPAQAGGHAGPVYPEDERRSHHLDAGFVGFCRFDLA